MHSTKKTSPKIKGFTLIELLVVIAIIGILSTVVIVSLNTARRKARDAQRVSEIREIQKALEMYYSDNGSYPNPGGGWRGECNHPWGTPNLASDQVILGLIPKYMPNFPADPSMDKTTQFSCFLYASNGTDYALLDHAIVDADFNYQSQPAFIDPARDGGPDFCVIDGTANWSWKIYSPGAACW